MMKVINAARTITIPFPQFMFCVLECWTDETSCRLFDNFPVTHHFDGDFLFLESIDNLLDLYDSKYALQCCKHCYNPTNLQKMDGKPQTSWPRKNWSSLMIFNNEHPKNKTLNPLTINNQSGAFLHRFRWLEDDEIGTLPLKWNWLVDWYKKHGFKYLKGYPEEDAIWLRKKI